MNTERWLTKLESEAAAQKQSFPRSAADIQLITKSLDFSTSQNATTLRYSSGNTLVVNDAERVQVTYDTAGGSNTVAVLEIATDGNDPKVRRVPYTGGARWIVTANTKGTGSWQPTNYTFVVEALLDGTLRAENMTS